MFVRLIVVLCVIACAHTFKVQNAKFGKCRCRFGYWKATKVADSGARLCCFVSASVVLSCRGG